MSETNKTNFDPIVGSDEQVAGAELEAARKEVSRQEVARQDATEALRGKVPDGQAAGPAAAEAEKQRLADAAAEAEKQRLADAAAVTRRQAAAEAADPLKTAAEKKIDLLRKNYSNFFSQKEGKRDSSRDLPRGLPKEIMGIFGKEEERERFEALIAFAEENQTKLLREGESINELRKKIGDKGLNTLLSERIKEKEGMEGAFEEHYKNIIDSDENPSLRIMELLSFAMEEHGTKIPESARYLLFGQLQELRESGKGSGEVKNNKCSDEVIEAVYKTLRGEDLGEKAKGDLIFAEIGKKTTGRGDFPTMETKKEREDIENNLNKAKEILSKFTGKEVSDLTVLALLDSGLTLEQIADGKIDIKDKKKEWAWLPFKKVEVSTITIGKEEFSLEEFNKRIQKNEEKFKQKIGENFNKQPGLLNRNRVKMGPEATLTSVWERVNKEGIKAKKTEILNAEAGNLSSNIDKEYAKVQSDLLKGLERMTRKSGTTGQEGGGKGIGETFEGPKGKGTEISEDQKAFVSSVFEELRKWKESGQGKESEQAEIKRKKKQLEMLDGLMGEKPGSAEEAIKKLEKKDQERLNWVWTAAVTPLAIVVFFIFAGVLLMSQGADKKGK